MIGTREVSVLAATVLWILVRPFSAVVLSVAEFVLRYAAVVTRTPPIAGLTRMVFAILPCVVKNGTETKKSVSTRTSHFV